MNVILPMAGFGSRLRPLTWSKPKPLVPVAGKPLLGHVMDMFVKDHELNTVVFIVGFLGEQVQTYIQKVYPSVQAEYREQKELLGQSHAIWQAQEFLSGPVMILFVDTLIDANFRTLAKDRSTAVAWVKRVEDPRRFGVAELDSTGFVKRLVEKPEEKNNDLALVGCYYFPEGGLLREAIRRQMEEERAFRGEFFLVDAINLVLAEGLRMRVQEVSVWEDCGTPDTLLHANRYLLENGRENSAVARCEGTVVVPPVFIDPAAVVCRSVVGPYVSLAAGCRVENSILQDCVVDEEAEISNTVLSDSLIGSQGRIVGKKMSVLVGESSEIRQR